jgi:hypothetical protein
MNFKPESHIIFSCNQTITSLQMLKISSPKRLIPCTVLTPFGAKSPSNFVRRINLLLGSNSARVNRVLSCVAVLNAELSKSQSSSHFFWRRKWKSFNSALIWLLTLNVRPVRVKRSRIYAFHTPIKTQILKDLQRKTLSTPSCVRVAWLNC